jgi:hypothetical protein
LKGLTSLTIAAGAGILLGNGYVLIAALAFLVAIYEVKGMLFE